MIKQKTPAAQLNAFADEIGAFIEYWGFKKIHGVIWTHLYLSNVPLSALELIAKLKVSKALVSISMKDLIHYRLIIQTPESEDKKNKFYYANPDVFGAIKNVLENREMKMMERIRTELKSLKEIKKARPDSTKDIINSERLEHVDQMIMGANGVLKTMINLGDLDSKLIQMMFSAR